MRTILTSILLALPLLLSAQVSSSPAFMTGYVSAKLEDKYSTNQIEVNVVGQEIIVYSWPAEIDVTNVKLFLEECCPEFLVHLGSEVSMDESECSSDTCLMADPELVIEETSEQHLLPELNPFFPTMLAQPHMLGYSIGCRSSDKIFKSSIPVSIGDQFCLFQIKSLHYGRLYFGIEACVWAIFDARPKSLSLINADYFVALPFTYFNDRFSARFRLFHESSHLGDEFLLEHPGIERFNPSMEVVDLTLAYEPIDHLQIFLGYASVLRSDDGFRIQPNSVHYGFNYFLNFAKIKIFNLVAFPYVAAYFTNNEKNHWNLDSSVTIGYQWDKCYGRKLRLYVMGHEGCSAEGQFGNRTSRYVSVNLMYGY